uniref:Uncharacterized protein n=1 Tax=Nelumbo nucifera TaxID=4432 RepID=A0A822Y6T1_NELNU|nr:TPA_asm: hypothetical protein HUJ06_028517 [Nelumbo nucifera]
MKTNKPNAVVVGGSIAGISCVHALTAAGWDAVVLEKSCPHRKSNRCWAWARSSGSEIHRFMSPPTSPSPQHHPAPHHRSESSNRWGEEDQLDTGKG